MLNYWMHTDIFSVLAYHHQDLYNVQRKNYIELIYRPGYVSYKIIFLKRLYCKNCDIYLFIICSIFNDGFSETQTIQRRITGR
jgi:hypothetical protein